MPENAPNKRLYVGNLSFKVSDDDLGDIFAECGDVITARVIMDRDTDRSKGFGFVEMGKLDEAASAISKFNGEEFNGRSMSVSYAAPRKEIPGGRKRNRGKKKPGGPNPKSASKSAGPKTAAKKEPKVAPETEAKATPVPTPKTAPETEPKTS